MKIAVLFGSFNPMTNAHLTALKTAVEQLSADKGFFVCTSGKYLRKKTVKLDAPFYLSEEERREIIEKTCAGEEKLSFWGFERGGYIPRRYLTLCDIQKAYPEAELYEVQGADKVRSTARFSNAEEYLSHIRFAVFDRDGIDLEGLIADEPILARHRSAFTILPAPAGVSEVSSTAVRRRFYDGKDCSDLIPSAAVEVLSRHTPDEFFIPYEERMKAIIRSGRFGINKACKEVYAENRAIFDRWREGGAEVDLGDYQSFLDGTTLHREAFDVSDLGRVYPTTQTGCINADCVDVAEELIAQGYNPAILNLASAGRPGGGYDLGMHAQEESLCQASNLSLSLYQFGNPAKLKCVRDCGAPVREVGYPLDMNFGGVYTPEVTFFRNNSGKFFTLREKPLRCDVITVAALSFNGRNDFARAAELAFRAPDGGFNPAGEEVMLNKIRTIFRLGVKQGKDALVLGAFGCGAYRLPSSEVSRLFRVVMNEPEFAGKFRLLVFAILESTRKPNGLSGKFADFYREFGTFEG